MDIGLCRFPAKDILEACRVGYLVLIPFCSKMVVLNSQEDHIRVLCSQLEAVIAGMSCCCRHRKESYLVVLANSILEWQHHHHRLEWLVVIEALDSPLHLHRQHSCHLKPIRSYSPVYLCATSLLVNTLAFRHYQHQVNLISSFPKNFYHLHCSHHKHFLVKPQFNYSFKKHDLINFHSMLYLLYRFNQLYRSQRIC